MGAHSPQESYTQPQERCAHPTAPGARPMVVGHHLIWTAYGWWLPNDPRGSSSHEIRVDRIADLGELHYGRKLVQPKSAEVRLFYQNARKALKYDLLTFSPEAVAVIADAFAAVIAEQNYTCY